METRIKVCRLLKKFLFATERYPVFDGHFLSKEIKPNCKFAAKHELNEYLENTTRSNRVGIILLILVYTGFLIKWFVVPIKYFSIIDFEDIDRNLKAISVVDDEQTGFGLQEKQAGWYKFVCLATNCTHLDDNESQPHSLGYHLLRLPILLICYPSIDRWYPPTSRLEAFGMLVLMMCGFGVWLLGCFWPLQQFVYPAKNLLMMFIVAPNLTTQLMLAKSRRFLDDYSVSLGNFELNPIRLYYERQSSLFDQIRVQRQILMLSNKNKQEEKQTNCWLSLPAGATKTNTTNDNKNNKHETSTADWIHQQQAVYCPKMSIMSSAKQSSFLKHKSEEQISQMVADCLPVCRTDWWRNLAASLLVYCSTVTVVGFCFAGFVVLYIITVRAFDLQELLARFSEQTKQQNCLIKSVAPQSLQNTPTLIRRDNGTSTGQFENVVHDDDPFMATHYTLKQLNDVPLATLEVNWNWYSFAETVLVTHLPGFSIAILLAYYFVIMSEYNCWLAESITYMVASLAYTRTIVGNRPATATRTTAANKAKLLHSHSWMDNSSSPINSYQMEEDLRTTTTTRPINSDNSSSQFTMPVMKANFRSEVSWLFGVLICRLVDDDQKRAHYSLLNAKENDQMRYKRFIRVFKGDKQLAKSKAIQANHIETMEKVYINFRLLLDHIQSCHKSVVLLVSLTYLLNYGPILIVIVLTKQIKSFRSEESLYVIVGSFLISNSLILLGSNFHANSKRLSPLIWSFIAQLAHFDNNVRLRHLRELWLRQVTWLDHDGGIALKAFGFRVTYINIIQLIIWTGTLIVMALKY